MCLVPPVVLLLPQMLLCLVLMVRVLLPVVTLPLVLAQMLLSPPVPPVLGLLLTPRFLVRQVPLWRRRLSRCSTR